MLVGFGDYYLCGWGNVGCEVEEVGDFECFVFVFGLDGVGEEDVEGVDVECGVVGEVVDFGVDGGFVVVEVVYELDLCEVEVGFVIVGL